MRTIAVILVIALGALWVYYAAGVADTPTPRLVLVSVDGPAEEPSAATLNNQGVELAREGRGADSLAYFERARDFDPKNGVIVRNAKSQHGHVLKGAWRSALLIGSVLTGLLLGGGFVYATARGVVDGSRLRKLHVRGDPYFTIRPDDKKLTLPLSFTGEVGGLTRRHPLTIVWSSAGRGKHMKSRPPVRARGKKLEVQLDQDRLDRLRSYPGLWKGFLYLGKTPVGETAARVV